MSSKKPLRILHVVERMDRAGTETWLMNVLRHIDRKMFQMDFLTNTKDHCDYDDEIRVLGSRIIPCLTTHRPVRYAYNFKRILNRWGPFDFVHSHFRHYSGWVLCIAQRAGVPHRIAHIHSDISRLFTDATPIRRIYLTLMKRLINRYATAGLACSRDAAKAFFGPLWESDLRWKINYCGIDITPFKKGYDSAVTRAEFGISPDAVVVGHIGRFVEEKNHSFMLDIAAEVTKRRPDVRFLLIGDGPLQSKIVSKTRRLKIEKNVFFIGQKSDVPRLMTSAMDIFLLTSLFEGLPLVLIEAQAAGLPCVLSDVISKEVNVVNPLMHRISLSQPAFFWAEFLLRVFKANKPVNRLGALSMVAQSHFNIHESVRNLENFYRDFIEMH